MTSLTNPRPANRLQPAALLLLAVIASVALTAHWLAGDEHFRALGIGALPLSILLGMLLAGTPLLARLRNAPAAASAQQFVQKRLLQAGIVLFGFQLSLLDIEQVGWQALAADLLVISIVIPLGIWLGHKVLKLPLYLTVLLAIGSAVCGAAAILATVPVLDRLAGDKNEEERTQAIGIAVAAVAVFGTLSVLLYPALQQWFALSDGMAGIYIGSTVHEVAQALAASDALGQATQHNAVIVKLMRVLMLAPVLMVLAMWLLRNDDTAEAGAPRHQHRPPAFVGWFALVVGVNTLLPVVLGADALMQVRHLAAIASAAFLALAMTALGLSIHWQHLQVSGWRPLVLGALLWVLLLAGGGFLCSLF